MAAATCGPTVVCNVPSWQQLHLWARVGWCFAGQHGPPPCHLASAAAAAAAARKLGAHPPRAFRTGSHAAATAPFAPSGPAGAGRRALGRGRQPARVGSADRGAVAAAEQPGGASRQRRGPRAAAVRLSAPRLDGAQQGGGAAPQEGAPEPWCGPDRRSALGGLGLAATAPLLVPPLTCGALSTPALCPFLHAAAIFHHFKNPGAPAGEACRPRVVASWLPWQPWLRGCCRHPHHPHARHLASPPLHCSASSLPPACSHDCGRQDAVPV